MDLTDFRAKAPRFSLFSNPRLKPEVSINTLKHHFSHRADSLFWAKTPNQRGALTPGLSPNPSRIIWIRQELRCTKKARDWLKRLASPLLLDSYDLYWYAKRIKTDQILQAEAEKP
jgi:hypothetical protein